MTPQSHFMVVAPIIAERVNALRALLSSMNDRPGMAKPDNSIVPFGELENLHFARFVILDDQTLHDFEEYGAPIPDFAVLLAFLGDCDGPADELPRRHGAPRGAGPASDLFLLRGFHARLRSARLDEDAFAGPGRELRELGRPHRQADPRRSHASR